MPVYRFVSIRLLRIVWLFIHSPAIRAFTKMPDACAAIAADIAGKSSANAADTKPYIDNKQEIAYII